MQPAAWAVAGIAPCKPCLIAGELVMHTWCDMSHHISGQVRGWSGLTVATAA